MLITVLAVPVIINELYKLDFGYRTLWNAADVLAFYGSFLSFIGALSLGVVALLQNKKLSEANRNLTKLQLEEYTPYVIVEKAVEDNNHIEHNRLPDTTQSVHGGRKGNLLFSSIEEQENYMETQKNIEEATRINSEQIQKNGFTPEIADRAAEISRQSLELRKRYPGELLEEYWDTFWIINSADERLQDSFIDRVLLNCTSLKIVLRNESKAKIKKIIIKKMIFDAFGRKWTFNPNPQHNRISKVIRENEKAVLYINLFWDKNDANLKYIFEQSSVYETIINLELLTIGEISQDEKIAMTWAWGNSNEFTIELS